MSLQESLQELANDDHLETKLHHDSLLATQVDVDGRTVLHWACSIGNAANVRTLLGRDDIEINKQEISLWTPLMISVSAGHEHIAEMLLSRDDINVELLNANGANALYVFSSLPLLR